MFTFTCVALNGLEARENGAARGTLLRAGKARLEKSIENWQSLQIGYRVIAEFKRHLQSKEI